jgi:hypothetical protein
MANLTVQENGALNLLVLQGQWSDLTHDQQYQHYKTAILGYMHHFSNAMLGHDGCTHAPLQQCYTQQNLVYKLF